MACAIVLRSSTRCRFSLSPYLLIWGLLLFPTFLAWTAFVTAAYAAAGNRYAAYAIAFAVLAFSGYKAITGRLSWAGNWPLWGAFRWSDLGFFETDRSALILNRVMVLGSADFSRCSPSGCSAVAAATRCASCTGSHRAPGAGLRLLPYAAVPVAACILLSSW